VSSKQWTHLGKFAGRFSIPWEKASLVAYPTNFLKKYSGHKYNFYHHMHVSNLKELHQKSGKPIFLEYANRWAGYTRQWSTMPIYTKEDIRLTPVNNQ
jgi:hypothetical protein